MHRQGESFIHPLQLCRIVIFSSLTQIQPVGESVVAVHNKSVFKIMEAIVVIF